MWPEAANTIALIHSARRPPLKACGPTSQTVDVAPETVLMQRPRPQARRNNERQVCSRQRLDGSAHITAGLLSVNRGAEKSRWRWVGVARAADPDLLDVRPEELSEGGFIDINEENSGDKKTMSLRK